MKQLPQSWPASTDDLGTLHDLAHARAVQLRRQAIDDFFNAAAAAVSAWWARAPWTGQAPVRAAAGLPRRSAPPGC
jgi:hypothetical protein